MLVAEPDEVVVGELVGELLRLVEVLLAVLADRHLREADVEVEAAGGREVEVVVELELLVVKSALLHDVVERRRLLPRAERAGVHRLHGEVGASALQICAARLRWKRSGASGVAANLPSQSQEDFGSLHT